MEVLIEAGTLQLRQVERDGWGGVLILAEQFMASEVVLREGDEFWGWRGAFAGEDLGVDMARELLDANFVEACF